MFRLRSIIFFVALAICSALVVEAQNYNCGQANRGMVKAAVVNKAYANAPDTLKAGNSSYPHQYYNSENLAFPPKCKTFNSLTFALMEFPVNADGTPFPWKQKRDGPSPPYRIVYTVDRSTQKKQFFCGLMAHPTTDPTNFRLCTPPASLNVESCEDGNGECSPLIESGSFMEEGPEEEL